MKKNPKISSTAYRVILLMSMLNDKEYSIEELNSVFSNDPHIARTFSKEVILKYISTLRLAGYKVSKPSSSNKYKYTLSKSPVLMDLTDEDLKTLTIMEEFISGLYQTKLRTKYNNLLNKISKYLTDEQVILLNRKRDKLKDVLTNENTKYSKYADIIQKIEKYCIEDQRITINYKIPVEDDERQIILEPKEIKYAGNDVYISGYNPISGEKQLLHLDYIQKIKQLPIKSRYNHILSPVIFKLTGRLAKGYRPYEGEKILEIDQNTGITTIAAYVDDKTILLRRLLKYGDYCEILYPKSIRHQAFEIISQTLKNYENAD